MLQKVKTNIILVLSLLVLLLGGFGYFQYTQAKRYAQEAKKWESNYNSEKTKHQKTSQRAELTSKELKEEKELVEILKEENIKPRKTQFVYRVQYRDTGSVRVKVLYVGDSANKRNYPITSYFEQPCYKAYWTYFPTLDSSEHIWEKETNMTAIGHWERENKFQIFGKTLFHYGKKNNYVTIKDNCTDSEIITNQFIDIKKK